MCLISVLPKGTKKYGEEVEAFITSGFKSNRDGSGFMYKRNDDDKICVKKGYFNLDEMLQDILSAKLNDDDELVIHHRIGTSGLKSPENTHPFVISHDPDEISSTDIITTNSVLVHNGIFRGTYEYEKLNGDFSDTYAFVRYYMANGIEWFKNDTKSFLRALDGIIGYSKLCVLFPDRDLIMTGGFTEDNGYYHSNAGYKSWSHRDVGGVTENNASSSKKSGIGQKDGATGINPDQLSLLKDSQKSKAPLVLNGNIIDITEFNYKHFVYQEKGKNKVCRLNNWVDEGDEDLVLEADKGHFIQMTPCTIKTLHSDYDFHPKNEYKMFYMEYVRFLGNVSISKNVLKIVHRYLTKDINVEATTIFEVKGHKVTKFTLINYFMSLHKNYFTKSSQFYTTRVCELTRINKVNEEVEDAEGDILLLNS